MPLLSEGAKVQIDFESRVDELLADTKRVIDQQEQLKEETKETNETLRRSAKEAEDAAKKQTMSWTDFRSMYSTVLDVVRVGQAVWEETGAKFVDNAVLVGNLARSMGTTTEEASKLKEVADDVGISVDSLKTSMKLALKDGFEPNIDGLARMSDEYLKLAPGTERMQYLLDRFGKSGEEMGKLLEKGGDSIRSMADAMDEGLIVTEEAYQQAREYQVAVDGLKDSWDAFTYESAPPLVNAVTNVVNVQRDAMRAQEILNEQGLYGLQVYDRRYTAALQQAKAEREEADATVLAAEAAEQAGGAFESEAEQAARLADEAKVAEQAIKDMTKTNQEFLKLTEDLTKSQESYNEKMSDLAIEHDKLLAKKKELIAQGYVEEGKTIQELNEKIDENMAKQEEATDAFELDGRRRILSMLEQQLMLGGLSEAESTYLLDLGLKWGVYTEEAVADAKAAQEEVRLLTDAFNSLPTEKSITITTSYVDQGVPSYIAENYATGYAEGGISRGSDSGHLEMLHGTEAVIPLKNGSVPVEMKGGGSGANDNGNKDVINAILATKIDEKRLAKSIVQALSQMSG